MVRRLITWLLGEYPSVEQWAYRTRYRHIQTIHQRRQADLALRDYKAQIELSRMQDILDQCRNDAKNNAALSTSRKIIASGIDANTAAVMLQNLYFLSHRPD